MSVKGSTPGQCRWGVIAGWIVACGASGLVAQGTGGVVFPHVDVHGRGIPGVTRPMGMAGVASMGMAWPNPHWVGAAAMFAPELLMRGAVVPGMGSAGTSPTVAARTAGIPSQSPVNVSAAWVVAGPSSGPTADERLLAFQQAEARKGSPGAQRALAERYEKGVGVERSEELARAWREAAARSERAHQGGASPGL